MKNTFKLAFLACVASLALSACGDKEPTVITPEKIATADYQKVLYYDITATWCGPCGQYGIPDFKAALAADTASVGFSCHPSNNNDVLFSPIAVELDNLLYPPSGASGIPSFGEGINGYEQSMQQCKTAGAARKAAGNVLAGLGVRQTVSGDTLKIDARVKFLKADAGNKIYALGVYILQDGIAQQQAGAATNPFVHDHLIVGKATLGYGETIKSGAVTATDNIGKSYIFVKNKANMVMSKMYAAVVLWEVNAAGKPITFINVNKVKL